MLDDVGSRERRNFCGVVRRAVVHDDDLFRVLLRTEDDGADRWALVEGGNRSQDAKSLARRWNALGGRGAVLNDSQEIPPLRRGRSFRESIRVFCRGASLDDEAVRLGQRSL